MSETGKLFIDGAWVAPTGTQTVAVSEAATGETIAEITLASAGDAELACQAARRAFAAWSALTPAERAAFLSAIADRLEADAEGIARTIAREVGMPLRLAHRIQVGSPIVAWRRCAALAETYPWREQVGHSIVERIAAGVALCITPWNYPLHQITAKVAPALLAGCTVVLKPSEIAPSAAYALARAAAATGLPAGVLNIVVGSGGEVGEALVANPDVDIVSLTGSTATGRRVAETAARSLKRVSLELGGKSAAILLPQGDAAAAVRAVVASCFLNSGQTCSALTRLLVPAERQAEVTKLIVDAVGRIRPGDPLDPETRLGPLVSEEQRRRVLGFIDSGIGEGARLICGGAGRPAGLERGYFVQPTVFADVSPRMRIAQEEIFGPVLCVMAYRTVDEAVAIANGTPYGLAAAVWGGDEESAREVGRRLRAGQVDINGAPFNLDAPFGGFGQSGIGRENGKYGVGEFIELRSLQMPMAKGVAA
ncbi:aldehyde dehydrogenase family protein [bacterium]|nr:aldehyde dehydrogenase family protein [bacterium]